MFTKYDRDYLNMRFDRIDRMLRVLTKFLTAEGEAEMAKFDELRDSVQKQTTVIEGVTALLDDIARQLAEAGNDPVKLEELRTTIETNTAKLSAAVARNTDADDEVHAAGM
jgi:phage-related tail protein